MTNNYAERIIEALVTERDQLRAELASEKLVSTRLRTSWREDCEALQSEIGQLQKQADREIDSSRAMYSTATNMVTALQAERDQLRAALAECQAWRTGPDGVKWYVAETVAAVAELARVREADRLTSFGGLTVCPTCKVFTDMDRHWCYPLPGGAFCMGFKDALAAGKG